MTKDEALRQLQDTEVVPCISGSIADIKEVLDACLAIGVPAVLDREESCASGGCAPRIDLCVRAEDLPRVMQMMHERWQSLLDQEGTLPDYGDATDEAVAQGADVAGAEHADDDPPCPACGTAGPLVAGACKGCGLQLE